jgi:hypothetical protein
MEIKTGRLRSASWRACYYEDKDLYVAKYQFGSDMMISNKYYKITKEVFDKLDSECDDSTITNMLKSCKLLYEYSDSKWGGSISQCNDANWQSLCDWDF